MLNAEYCGLSRPILSIDSETASVSDTIPTVLMPKLTRCNSSEPASVYSKQGDTPSARLSKLGCGLYCRQQYSSSWTATNADPEPSDFRKPKYIENGDPLQDEEKLLQGLPIVEPEDEVTNTIRKVPSDQALMPLRWGSNRRATGRSKSGLQVRLQTFFAHCISMSLKPSFESTIATHLILQLLFVDRDKRLTLKT